MKRKKIVIKNFLKPTVPDASPRGISPVSSRLPSEIEILYFTSPRTAKNGSPDLSQGEVNRKPRPKGRRIFRLVHIIAAMIAFLTIVSFFGFSLLAEIMGNNEFIIKVKTTILYCLPILIIAMPAVAVSGNKLAGKSEHPLVLAKAKRMKFIAANGFILIGLAIYLYYHATNEPIDQTFLMVQVVELAFGFTNLMLMGLNIRDGFALSK